jgi:hypothetical protein
MAPRPRIHQEVGGWRLALNLDNPQSEPRGSCLLASAFSEDPCITAHAILPVREVARDARMGQRSRRTTPQRPRVERWVSLSPLMD